MAPPPDTFKSKGERLSSRSSRRCTDPNLGLDAEAVVVHVAGSDV